MREAHDLWKWASLCVGDVGVMQASILLESIPSTVADQAYQDGNNSDDQEDVDEAVGIVSQKSDCPKRHKDDRDIIE